MKRLFLICTLFLLSFVLFAVETQFSVTSSPKSFSFVSVLNDEDLSYLVSLSRPEDKFVLKAPTILSLHTNGWYVGEIRKSGLLSFIEAPSEKAFSAYETKPFQKVYSPALNPQFSGLSKSTQNADFAVFSPVFSPTSPSGFYIDLFSKHLYMGALFVDYHEKQIEKYQVDWDCVNNAGKNLYTIFGFNDSTQKKEFNFQTSAFFQLRYRDTVGITGMLGYNLGVKYKEYEVNTFKRISCNSSGIPIDRVGYSISNDFVTLSYELENYCKPSYGGTNQKKVAIFTTKLDSENFSFKMTSILQADIDTGRTASTSYEINYEDTSLKIGINRPTLTLNNLDFEAKIQDAKFCVNGTKYSVSISWDNDLIISNKAVNVKLKVNQDRVYTAGFKLVF